jgi:hypothetical protein
MEFKCEHCNKQFKSYQSRWNHVNRYHNNTVSEKVSNSKGDGKDKSKEKINKVYECRYCDKIYKHKQTRYAHEKICKTSENNENLKDIVKEQNKQIQELKDMLQKALKIHPKTLQKINNQLNNSHNNNGIINNYYLQVGNEGLNELMSAKEKKYILNLNGNCINELIRKVHVSPDEKYKKCKNVYITNLQNNIGYMYDEKKNKFVAVKKDDLLQKLIDYRLFDIESFMNEHKDELEPHIVKNLERFLERMDKDEDLIKMKKDQIKLILYNSKDDILEQIKEEGIEI